ncbi:MAG: hypothetical protein ACYC55_05105 [Candidatus Geothermincolia bacterium]
MRPGARAVMVPLLVLLLLAGLGIFGCDGNGGPSGTPQVEGEKKSACDLRQEMREVWDLHGWLTRELVLAFTFDSPEQDDITSRLLANQEEIGDYFARYYSKEDGDQLRGLLEDHILLAAEALDAAKSLDTATLNLRSQDLSNNGQEIAGLLNRMNPGNWTEQEVIGHWTTHLTTLLTMATSVLGGDYPAAITANDTYYDAILQMADFFSEGIEAQFPDKIEASQTPAAGPDTCEIRTQARRLWAYHGWYTREFVAASVLGTPNASAIAPRLLQNQTDIGTYFGQFIGAENGTELAGMLQEHITIAVEVVTAAKAGDDQALREADGRWRQNGNDIATFLFRLSPEKLDLDRLQDDWGKHLDQVTAIATAFLEEDYQQAVEVTDEYIMHIFGMSDYVVSGL